MKSLEKTKLEKEDKLHPHFELLREISKRGILDDDLIIRLSFRKRKKITRKTLNTVQSHLIFSYSLHYLA
jgi:hypothetical protein